MSWLLDATFLTGSRLFWMFNGAMLALALSTLPGKASPPPAASLPAVASTPPGQPCPTALPCAPSPVVPVGSTQVLLPPPRPAKPLLERGCSGAQTTGMARDQEVQGLFLTRSRIEHFLENQPLLMHGGRVVPEMRDGKAVGVRLFGIRPGSTLGLLGFENGDVLMRVGEYEVASPDSALEAYARLRTSDRITALIARKGQALWLDFYIC
jgi:hypothetical protein